MPVLGTGIRFGGVRFTNRQATFLQAGIRQGLGVRELRTIFRERFNRGLPSPAFTAARGLLSQAEIAGIQFQRLAPGRRLRTGLIPTLEVGASRSKFLITAKTRVRVRATGAIVERIIRFGTNEVPTIELFRQRAQDIISKGVAQAESAMDFLDFEGVSVTELVVV